MRLILGNFNHEEIIISFHSQNTSDTMEVCYRQFLKEAVEWHCFSWNYFMSPAMETAYLQFKGKAAAYEPAIWI